MGMIMNLTQHFSLSELTRSDVATRLDIDNTPTNEHLANLKLICEKVLEPIRLHFNKPITINSGYRSLKLNESVNKSTSAPGKISKHCLGQAVDFEIVGVSNYDLAIWAKNNLPEFHQIILEFYTPGNPSSGWVHISYVPGNQKKEVLTAHKVNGKLTYTPGLLA